MDPGLSDVRILVVGGASLDTLTGADELVAGGAGMYTAMAANRSGATVTLFAPRPSPMPRPLQAVADAVDWLGPTIGIDDLARFEISYEDGTATYETSHFGAEEILSANDLPKDLSSFDFVHLVPLGNLERQHEFLLACRSNGARRVSVGTALHLIDRQSDAAATAIRDADLVFMNTEEAVRLFGSVDAAASDPRRLLFITQGKEGATVVQGKHATSLEGVAASVVDPTGAGDSFCGATLVELALGKHPVLAAEHAMPLAAEVTEHVGARAVFSAAPAPELPMDTSVGPRLASVKRIARAISTDGEISPFPFTGADLPPPDHPATLDYFFASTLQQFGFWTIEGGRYGQPLLATIASEERKGAFYLFQAYLRWLNHDPEMLTPARQAQLSKDDLLSVLRADDGSDPMPAIDMHLALARQYGNDMLALRLTPQAILDRVSSSKSPLTSLFQILDHVGGYKEDPLRKKAALLAIILRQRPEAFLCNGDEDVPPVIDYHVMRSCLRTGLIDIRDDKLKCKIEERRLLTEPEERAVRNAAYSAIEQVVVRSGKSTGAVDWFFFQARKRCPEMTEPQCAVCPVDSVCAHRKSLFQPVRRTSFY